MYTQDAEDALAESTLLWSIPLVLSSGDSDSPRALRDVQQWLETFLVVTSWGKGTTNIYG